MVAADPKLVKYIVEELQKDAHEIKEKMRNLKFFNDFKLKHTRMHYHQNMDKLMSDVELKVMYQMCEPDTMSKLERIRDVGWGNFKACVNMTRTFADAEVAVYDSVEFLEQLGHLVANISKGIAECRHKSVFKALSCVMQTVSNHSDDYKEKSEAVLELLSRMDNITREFTETFAKCISNTENFIYNTIDKIMKEKCRKESLVDRISTFFRRYLYNFRKDRSLFKPTEERLKETVPITKGIDEDRSPYQSGPDPDSRDVKNEVVNKVNIKY